MQRERKSIAEEAEEEKAVPLLNKEESRGLIQSSPLTDYVDEEASVAAIR